MRKKQKHKILQHTCPLFSIQFEIYEAWTYDEYKATAKTRHGLLLAGKNSGGSTTLCKTSSGPLILVWTAKGQGDAALVHELVHAANMTLACVGVYASLKHDEIQAYYIDYLFRVTKGVL